MNRCFNIFNKDKARSSPEASASKPSKSKTKKSRNKSAPELRNERDFGSSEATTSGGGVKSTGSRSIPEMYREKEHNLRVFSYSELREATNNFNRLLKIGEGGFGSVYKGSVKLINNQEPTIVAIKKLNTHGLQGHKQWVAEVQFLGVLEHPNLVKLLGYCSVEGERGTQRLLVYEYMPNKSLEDHLFNRTKPLVPWINRLKIILGAAQGMAYLHEGFKVQDLQVIYRDFKTSNILLDRDFSPKLSDFGLAREGPSGELTHVSTAPVGTRGYAAPEYIELGHLTVKSDIWSFGVVLYEIITGRRTIERNLPSNEQRLLEWVKEFPADGRRFSMIVDRRLQNNYSLNAARRIAKLADWCLSKNPKDRPSMSQVVEVLKQAIEESESEAHAKESSMASSSSSSNWPFRGFGKGEAVGVSRQMAQTSQVKMMDITTEGL